MLSRVLGRLSGWEPSSQQTTHDSQSPAISNVVGRVAVT
jgi:hypothetical protein